jgi:hypothetical protein
MKIIAFWDMTLCSFAPSLEVPAAVIFSHEGGVCKIFHNVGNFFKLHSITSQKTVNLMFKYYWFHSLMCNTSVYKTY